MAQQPRAGRPCQSSSYLLNHPLQGRGPALIAHRQTRYLLDERSLRAGRVLAVQASDRYIDHHRSTADRFIGDVPYVTAVLPVRRPATLRTGHRDTVPGPHRDPDQPRANLHFLDLHRGQLR
jgi:hypothetical protein